MKALIFWLLLAFSSRAGTVLILTEPTARGLAGRDFDRWVVQIQREGWTPIVREGERWTGSVVSNDWRLLNWQRDEVARIQPDAVQIFGRLARLKTGVHNKDGHGGRCILTDSWLSPNDVVFSDSGDTGTTAFAGVDPLIVTNKPNDGIPDQVNWPSFQRPVVRLDASGMTSTAGNFSGGYLDGQPHTPAIDEGYWLRCYLSNNIAYRRGEWTTPTNGFIDSTIWTDYTRITSTNKSVAWTNGGWTVAPGQYRWYYSQTERHLHTLHTVSSNGVWTRPVVTILYKSYQMEDTDGQRHLARWMFPGFVNHPISLNIGWCYGSFGVNPFYSGRAGDVTIADVIRSSVLRAGNGDTPFDAWLYGDVTLPLAPVVAPGAVVTVSNFSVP